MRGRQYQVDSLGDILKLRLNNIVNDKFEGSNDLQEEIVENKRRTNFSSYCGDRGRGVRA